MDEKSNMLVGVDGVDAMHDEELANATVASSSALPLEDGNLTSDLSSLPHREATRRSTRAVRKKPEAASEAAPKKAPPKTTMWNDRRIYTRSNSPLVKVDIAVGYTLQICWHLALAQHLPTETAQYGRSLGFAQP